jgi:hypothetical protein
MQARGSTDMFRASVQQLCMRMDVLRRTGALTVGGTKSAALPPSPDTEAHVWLHDMLHGHQ